ncbi:MAG: Bifunctional NADP phosphatase/NAD kinase [Candidatus Woesearchaeota archaeon]|nr:Bifunctional NADP phosphatase/NAD kinase [Candidatus Woesearchaeota archaeon]
MAGISLPFYKEVYFAQKGKGAYKNNKKIQVSNEKKLKNVLFAYSLDYSDDLSKTDKESQIIKQLVSKVRNIRSTNSVVEWAYTADGRLGGGINQTTKIWDIAAPSLIIKEAGGIVTDINGKELNFKVSEKDYQKNFSFVASNKTIHKKLMNIIDLVNLK